MNFEMQMENFYCQTIINCDGLYIADIDCKGSIFSLSINGSRIGQNFINFPDSLKNKISSSFVHVLTKEKVPVYVKYLKKQKNTPKEEVGDFYISDGEISSKYVYVGYNLN